MIKLLRLLPIALLPAVSLAAQTPVKQPLTPAAYDGWMSIAGDTLSADGRWVAYTLTPQVGEGELVVRSTAGATEYRHSRGFIGRPQEEAGAKRDEGFRAPPARFTADGRRVVFTIEPPRAAVEAAPRAKAKQGPKPSLGILELATGQTRVIPRVKSFRLAPRSGRWLAYLTAGDTTPPDSAAPSAAAAAPGGTARPIAADSARKRQLGTPLMVREMATGAETPIPDVREYALNRSGEWLAYTVAARDSARDGVYLRRLGDGRVWPLLTGAGQYKTPVFDRAGTQLAWVADPRAPSDTARDRTPRWTLYRTGLRAPVARAAVQPRDSLSVSPDADLRWSEDGGVLVFGMAPPVPDSIPADSLADKAVFDLWSYKDARLQPEQRVEAAEDRKRAYTAVLQTGSGRYRVLGSDTLQEVTVARNGRAAMALTSLPYAIPSMWGEGGSDVYALDPQSGERRLVAERVPFGARLSPDGRFILYWGRDRRWHAYETASGRTRTLTGGALADVRFDQETWDTPSFPAPWGVGGWTRGDRSVLLYDRYDVWDVDPTGRRAPRVVTDSVGRRGELVFRVTRPDSTEEALDPAQPLYLEATDERTKASGFFRDRLGAAQAPEQLVMADRELRDLSRATDAPVFVFTQQTVRMFPDLWVAGPGLADALRVSDANPQQARFRWADVELVRWRGDDGGELQGLLYKPEGFEPSRRYPMLVYFYEQLSDNLHRYVAPAGRNVINPTVYASNDYLVFEPDIRYRDGYPGPSAVQSIVPGVQALVRRGIVDPRRVGIQGQSWGGYQTAFLITRTPMFAAAMAGAPVANMTSAYGGIRWESGLARAFQYERTQSRIGGSLWEYPMRYIENSPLFAADRVSTPLLIMHNDADGAVPWYQGIELFVALRRLGKPVWLIDYNGEAHNPTKRANQIDISVRMQQFFDHYLKGAPEPEWMARGIPFLQKGQAQVSAEPEPGPTGGEPEPGAQTQP